MAGSARKRVVQVVGSEVEGEAEERGYEKVVNGEWILYGGCSWEVASWKEVMVYMVLRSWFRIIILKNLMKFSRNLNFKNVRVKLNTTYIFYCKN